MEIEREREGRGEAAKLLFCDLWNDSRGAEKTGLAL